MAPCPFCHPAPERITHQSEFALALLDAYPVAPGHTLVIPRQHVPSLYDLPAREQDALWHLVRQVRQSLTDQFQPDAFNIGCNDGPAAGQTVLHAHIHVIPRHFGDVSDPRGGIRCVIPSKARYWPL